MLTCKVGENIVTSFNKKNKEKIQRWSDKGILKCPMCSSQMIFKSGKINIWHFAHKNKCNFEDIYSEQETEEHVIGKKLLYQWFKKQPNIVSVELEKWIPEIKLRPDLLITDDKGEKYCIEYQCSPITKEKKDFKTDTYEMNNMKTIWIFGIERIGKNSKVAGRYRLSSKKRIFIKNKFKQRMNGKENFYFDYGEIFVNSEVQDGWKNSVDNYELNYKGRITSQQYEIYCEALIDLFDNYRNSDKGDFRGITQEKYFSMCTEYIQIKSLEKGRVVYSD